MAAEKVYTSLLLFSSGKTEMQNRDKYLIVLD
jgi:hypothetical protein